MHRGCASEEPDEGNLQVRFCEGLIVTLGNYPTKRCAMGSTRHDTDAHGSVKISPKNFNEVYQKKYIQSMPYTVKLRFQFIRVICVRFKQNLKTFIDSLLTLMRQCWISVLRFWCRILLFIYLPLYHSWLVFGLMDISCTFVPRHNHLHNPAQLQDCFLIFL